MRRTVIAFGILVALIAAACGGGGSDANNAAADVPGEPGIIRFATSPEPPLDWMEDQGIIEQMETESGIAMVTLETWQNLPLFAGGKVDVVSMGSYETPLFEQESGVDTTTFGMYNLARDTLMAADPAYQTASDIPRGCPMVVRTTAGMPDIWAGIIKTVDGRELAENSEDLPLLVADNQVTGDLILEGEACYGLADPMLWIPELRTGKLHNMYDGRGPSEMYQEIEPGHEGMLTNAFVARTDWYESHPEEVAYFLEVWQRALDEWHAHTDEIIDAYPQHFPLDSEADVEYVKRYLIDPDFGFDWFADSVYLTDEWIEAESGVIDLLVAADRLEEGAEFQRHVALEPESVCEDGACDGNMPFKGESGADNPSK